MVSICETPPEGRNPNNFHSNGCYEEFCASSLGHRSTFVVVKECGSYPARLQPASEEAYRPLFLRQQGAVISHGEEASNVKA